MIVEKVVIKNFKCFKNRFEVRLKDGMNILVGNNESGKSTIIEAINLCLTGTLNGRYIKNELSQNLFNKKIIKEYLDSINNGNFVEAPSILIELYMSGDGLEDLRGNGNTDRNNNACGVSIEIILNDNYKTEYGEYIKLKNIKMLPIEYYTFTWKTFSRDDSITSRSIPLKCSFIDSSNTKYQNGSEVYISRIVKELLEPDEIISISQAHRGMIESFSENEALKKINQKIQTKSAISSKNVSLNVNVPTNSAWENNIITALDDIPFEYIGKGEQCVIKTNLALNYKKTQNANIILIEEPEAHLSYSKLNHLLKQMEDKNKEKQFLISTHSSFVANKLGLDNLILLDSNKSTRLDDLEPDTKDFFSKISGYDTLRLILSNDPILVEGDSDELIIQRAYLDNFGVLPIENQIDVISVGTSFLRFLELASKLNKKVTVVTDSDGDIEALKEKYEEYIDSQIFNICYDKVIDDGDLYLDKKKEKKFNYNTLEPKLLKENDIKTFNAIFGTDYKLINDMHKYMKNNKTECALKIFESKTKINYPKYILNAIGVECE